MVNFNVQKSPSFCAMTEELAHVLKSPRGIFIDFVAPNSYAEDVGLKAGDILTELNGKVIDGSSEEALILIGSLLHKLLVVLPN